LRTTDLIHTTGGPVSEPPGLEHSTEEALPKFMASMVAAIPMLSLCWTRSFGYILISKKDHKRHIASPTTAIQMTPRS